MTGRKSDIRGHEPDMKPFEEFERRLQECLVHLYDPAYRPAQILWTVTDRDWQQGMETIQEVLIEAIQDMKPAPYVPPTARSRRIYGILSYRFVQDLTQEETAERLGITPRHLRREQSEAVQALALRLWEKSRPETLLPKDLVQEEEQGTDVPPADAGSPDWQSQVRQELASLQEIAPGAVAPVAESVQRVVGLTNALALKHSVVLKVDQVQPNLAADIHPSALRQVLIKAIGELVRHMSSGEIVLRAWQEEARIRIAITGSPVAVDEPSGNDLIREILTARGGSFETCIEAETISFQMELSSVGQDVLIVDDNPDMIHLYRRYAMGTRYHILHVDQGGHVFENIEAHRPDVIVLDVMLPDTDGWELLTHLREHPTTRSIPVIVCSVVREEDLALTLGAARYLPKPVQRREFIQTLDQVLSRASAEVSIP